MNIFKAANMKKGKVKVEKKKPKKMKVDTSIYSDPKYHEIMQRNDGGMFGFHKP